MFDRLQVFVKEGIKSYFTVSILYEAAKLLRNRLELTVTGLICDYCSQFYQCSRIHGRAAGNSDHYSIICTYGAKFFSLVVVT